MRLLQGSRPGEHSHINLWENEGLLQNRGACLLGLVFSTFYCLQIFFLCLQLVPETKYLCVYIRIVMCCCLFVFSPFRMVWGSGSCPMSRH